VKVEIGHWTGRAICTEQISDDDVNPLRTAVEQAVRHGARLVGANLDDANLDGANLVGASLVGASLDGASLDGANLVGANLVGANLVGANLVGASLDGANLVGANLVGASLDGANLVGASLVGASLVGASLVGASLDGANLVGASLDGANLDGASLDGASLVGIRDDFRAVLDSRPGEVAALLTKLLAGEIDGSTYAGTCSCLVGTIAKAAGCRYDGLVGLEPNADRPAEKWFLALRPGHTPDVSQVAAITVNWVLEWQAERGEGELIVGEVTP